METAVIAMAALACPVGMVVMGWFMARGTRKRNDSERPSIDDLRAEHRRLGAEIDSLEGADSSRDIPAARR